MIVRDPDSGCLSLDFERLNAALLMIVECSECGRKVQIDKDLVIEIGRQNIICEVCERESSPIIVDCQECGKSVQVKRDLVMDIGKNNIICKSCKNRQTEYIDKQAGDINSIKGLLASGIVLALLLLAGISLSIIEFNSMIATGLLLGSISTYLIYSGIKDEGSIRIVIGLFLLTGTLRMVSRGGFN